MDELLRALCAVHGVFLTREALALGIDDRTFRRLVRAGHWHRVRHGAYTFPDIWNRLDERGRHRLRSRAVARCARTAVAISHASAVMEHTDCWWDLDLTDVSVTRLDGRAGRREAGVRQHQGRLLPEDLHQRDGFTITSPTRTALDLTTTASVEQCLVVFDDFLRRGRTDKSRLTARYQDGMTHSPNTLATELVIALSDGRAESPGESRTRYFFWSQGLPMPELQHAVVTSAGITLGITDFWWEEYGVFGEFDGLVKYSRLLREGETASDAVVREKRREEAICEETGRRCIRFIWSDLHRREATRARVEQFLRAPRFRTHLT